ncbi:MAG: SelB C-terminal domain-containing protein [Acidimicrobiales bacterium]|nr:SelB C-terminal domain-containing protein [Acidimicrobiales bacterium]
MALGVSLHDQAVASAGTRALIALDSAVPPLLTRDELRNRAGITGRYLTDLVEREVLIEIPPFWTTPDRAKAWVATVTATISSTPSGVTTSGLRKALGLSRRYTLALLEWCDSQGITVRNDNLRRLI